MSYTTPPSPRWNDSDVNYPNVALAPDSISCSTWRVEILDYIHYIHTNCKCRFGTCNYGRTSLSKTQKKLGIITGESLCGHTYLQHFVNQKREELDTQSWDEINDWYYSDDEDDSKNTTEEDLTDEDEEEEEEFLESLELFKNNDGELTFVSKYIESLKNIPIQSI
jgi:hypothetical protein